jgi:WD40 repeat protein
VWDIKTGKTLLVYKEHSNWVYCVGIAPDGNTAITGSGDSTARFFTSRPFGLFYHTFSPLRVWDIRTGATLHVYDEHSSSVRCVGIAPDGNTAITGGFDNTARYSLTHF